VSMVSVAVLLFCAVSAVVFLLLWLLQWRRSVRVERELALSELKIQASHGGYFYWDAVVDSGSFSSRLVDMFNLHDGVCGFADFVTRFGSSNESAILVAFEDLKNGVRDSFTVDIKSLLDGEQRCFICLGNRIDDSEGVFQAIVVWFLDISEKARIFSKIEGDNKSLSEDIAMYRQLFDRLPVPIWTRSKSLVMSFYNDCCSGIFAAGVENGDEIVKALDAKMLFIAERARDYSSMQSERVNVILDGKRRLFNVVEIPVDNGSVGIAYDISEEEKAKDDLQRHVSSHADLLESSSSAVAIYASDKKLLFNNQSFASLWELDEQWLANNPSYGDILVMLREKRMLPEQTDFKLFKREQLDLFHKDDLPYSDFMYLPNGNVLRVVVVQHALGGLLFAYEDVTDRISMERSYNTLIAVQRETLDHLQEAVAVFGGDGKLKLYNNHFLEMWPASKEIVEKMPHVADLVESSRDLFKYEGEWSSFKENLVADTMGGEVFVKRVERSDGKVINRMSVPLFDGDVLVSFVDITDSIVVERSLRERNEALEEADLMKKKFLSSVSYELRTPLTSIVGFSEMLDHGLIGELSDKQRAYVQDIHKSSIYLMTLINDILDLASVEAGRMVLEVKYFDLQALFVTMVKLLQERAREEGIRLLFECDADVGFIYGDSRRLKQVMFNIIGNAIKFTPSGGNIVVGARVGAKNKIELWVKDTGIGIAKAELNKVFERFFRSEQVENMRVGGAGLGLSVVKHIVDLHGGSVKLSSRLGEGTVVNCVFDRYVLKDGCDDVDRIEEVVA